MAQITCNLFNKTFTVKKICKVCDMPKTANYFTTAYALDGLYDIWRTDSGILYSKPIRS